MDLKDIFNSLSAEDLSKLKEAAKGFLGDTNQEQSIPASRTEAKELSVFSDPQGVQKMMQIVRMMSASDDRIQFFSSIKPLLSDRRRKKADMAIMILQILRIQELLRNEEGENGNQN